MKMNCETASPLISRRMDGAISREEAEALDRHLGECAACRQELREQERLAAAIAALPEPESRSDLGERLRRAVFAQPAAPARRWRPILLRVAAMAAVVLLAVTATWQAAQLRAARTESARLAAALQEKRIIAAQWAAQQAALRIVPAEADVIEQLQAFRATREYLGTAMRWMASDGDQVELGMSGGPAKIVAGSDRENIILNLEYREIAGTEAPKIVSNPEFVLFSGDEVSVHFKGRSAGEPILRYRVAAERLVGGRIRTEVCFANEAVSREDVNGSLTVRTVLTPGKPVLIGAGGTGERRWELYLWGVARPVEYRGPQAEASHL